MKKIKILAMILACTVILSDALVLEARGRGGGGRGGRGGGRGGHRGGRGGHRGGARRGGRRGAGRRNFGRRGGWNRGGWNRGWWGGSWWGPSLLGLGLFGTGLYGRRYWWDSPDVIVTGGGTTYETPVYEEPQDNIDNEPTSDELQKFNRAAQKAKTEDPQAAAALEALLQDNNFKESVMHDSEALNKLTSELQKSSFRNKLKTAYQNR